MPWLALTLEVQADTAEALSEALLDAGALAVSIDDPEAERSSVVALLEKDADPAAIIAGLSAPPLPYRVETVEEADWVRTSQAQFQPTAIGRLWVGPTWCEAPENIP